MIEVETKFQISKGEIANVRRKAKELGRYIGREKKADTYYTLDDLNEYPKRSLRIRKRKGVYEINFKHRIFYEDGVYAKKEVEFKASNIDDFISLMKDFGFKKWLTKEKLSEVYQIKENFHIELNEVKGLGYFAEVEYLSDKKNMEKSKKEVLKVVKQLGASEKDLIKEGYTKLLWKKRKT